MRMAKVFLCGAGVAAALVCGGAGCQTKTKSIPPATKTWNDPAIGLTFRYPTVWTTNPKHQSYMRPMTLQPDQKPIVDAQFTGVGNLYGKTNLSELDFVYSLSLIHI